VVGGSDGARGHAGVGKIAFGMTGCREKVMPEWEK